MQARAAQSGWRRVELTLETLLARGFLTEEDVYEVQGMFEELHGRLQRGEISEHFIHVIMRKMAEDKVQAWRKRNGMHL
jgi:hypothetical protein